MRELEPVAVLRDQPGVDQLVDQRSKLRRGELSSSARQPRHRERDAQHRGGAQSCLGRLRQPRDPPPDGGLRGLGEAPSDRAPAPRAVASRAISETKSGLPAVRAVDRAGLLGRPACDRSSAATGRRRRRSPQPVEQPGLAACGDLRAASCCGGPAWSSWSRHPHTTSTARDGQVGGQELQQPQRALVDPVHVVEQQHHRPLAGDVVEHAVDRVEEREPPGSVGRRRPHSRRAAAPRSRPRSPHCPRWVCTAVTPRSTCDQTQNDGVPGSSQPVPRSTRQPSRAGRDLGEHPRLADARVAVQPQQPAASLAAVGQQRIDPGEHVVAAEERAVRRRSARRVSRGTFTGVLLRPGR